MESTEKHECLRASVWVNNAVHDSRVTCQVADDTQEKRGGPWAGSDTSALGFGKDTMVR